MDAIYWHPGFFWQVRRIDVLKPIRYEAMTFNYVKCYPTSFGKPYVIGGCGDSGRRNAERTQQRTTFLRDVAYVLHAELVAHDPSLDVSKHVGRFCKLARKGKSYRLPYLGLKICPARYALLERGDEGPQPLSESADLGMMMLMRNYDDPKFPTFNFRAMMVNGTIQVPEVSLA